MDEDDQFSFYGEEKDEDDGIDRGFFPPDMEEDDPFAREKEKDDDWMDSSNDEADEDVIDEDAFDPFRDE